MTVTIKRYNGMEFRDLAVTMSPVITEVAVSQYDKIVVSEPWTLQLHNNSYKYDPELLLSQWTLNFPVLQPRGVEASPYWRDEKILCRVHDFQKVRELRDFFFECFTTCDSILKGLIEV